MIIVEPKKDLVFIDEDDQPFEIDCAAFRSTDKTAVIVVDNGNEVWVERDPFKGRELDFDKEEYQKIIDEAYRLKDIRDTPVEETLDGAKKRKIGEINDKYSQILSPLIQGYPEIEMKTWSIQEEEARGYLKDSSHPTPLLDKILNGRNGVDGVETMQDLAQAVIKNSDEFKEIQVYTGYRQRLEKKIETATSISEVDAVQWEMQ